MKPVYLFIASILLAACQPEAPASESEQATTSAAIPVRAAEVKAAPADYTIRAVGLVVAEEEARPAFKIGGVIDRIFVEEGDRVRRGQVLARLNLTEINAQVEQTKVGLAKAQRDLERARNLFADSVATLEQVQDAETALEVAEENVEMASFNQDFATVRAPFSGKVIRKLMNEGEVTGPGSPVLALLNTDKSNYVVQAGLSDRDWASLQVGDPVTIRLDAYPEQTFRGSVSQLADVGNPQSGTFDVECRFEEPPPRLAVGLVANLVLHPATDSLLSIPIDALIESSSDSAHVFVLQQDGSVYRQTVLVGRLHTDRIAIHAGLRAGDTVITTGAPYLKSGNRVRIIQ